jgi:hypothetical protein
MGSDAPNVWIRSSAGELVRADALIHLRCGDGQVEATCADGRSVLLTGPGCPADFHVQLLLELSRVRLDDRSIVVICPLVTTDGARWTRAAADDLVRSGEVGGQV